MTAPQLILASSSPYRREILRKAGLNFSWQSPAIDETPLAGESALDLVRRLSKAKAETLSHLEKSLIIGSDQIAECENLIFGKPKDRDEAVWQLTRASGSTVLLHCGLALFNTRTGHCRVVHELCEIVYRTLNQQAIEFYVDQEKPYDICGSLRIEGPGISFLKQVKSNDPNALLGLPLIRLIDLLERET